MGLPIASGSLGRLPFWPWAMWSLPSSLASEMCGLRSSGTLGDCGCLESPVSFLGLPPLLSIDLCSCAHIFLLKVLYVFSFFLSFSVFFLQVQQLAIHHAFVLVLFPFFFKYFLLFSPIFNFFIFLPVSLDIVILHILCRNE